MQCLPKQQFPVKPPHSCNTASGVHTLVTKAITKPTALGKQASKRTHPCRGRLGSVLFAGLAQSLLARPLQARHKALGLLLIVFKCCTARPPRGGADRPQPFGHFTQRPAHCTAVENLLLVLLLLLLVVVLLLVLLLMLLTLQLDLLMVTLLYTHTHRHASTWQTHWGLWTAGTATMTPAVREIASCSTKPGHVCRLQQGAGKKGTGKTGTGEKGAQEFQTDRTQE